jgi:hypothetical protein
MKIPSQQFLHLAAGAAVLRAMPCLELQLRRPIRAGRHVAIQKALKEMRDTGTYTQMMEADMVRARKDAEDLIRPVEYYAIEEETAKATSRANG